MTWQERVKKFTHEVEHVTKVESCFLFKKYDRVLVAESNGQPIVVELRNEEPMTLCVAQKKAIYLNDLNKDRAQMNVLRE